MAKIVSKRDVENKKALRHRRAIQGSFGEDEEMEIVQGSYLDEILDNGHARAHITLSDRDKEDEIIKQNLINSGMLKFQGREVIDQRIPPQERKKLLEYAAQITGGDRDLIVEFADKYYSVYRKEPGKKGGRDYLPGFEFASYEKPKKKEVVEG